MRHRPDGVGVTALVTWASPPGRRRRSVHRSAKMAPRCRFGAFVYTVAPWAWVVGGLGIAIVYTNGRIGPLRAGLGRLCTLLGCCVVVDRRGDAVVYTDRRKRPLGAVSGHLCTLLRRESRYESRRELPAPGGASASTAMACRRRLLAGPSRLVGKTDSERVAPLPGWHLRRDINPHEPPKSYLNVVFGYRIRPSLRHGLTRPKMCCPFVERGHRSHAYQRHTPPHQ